MLKYVRRQDRDWQDAYLFFYPTIKEVNILYDLLKIEKPYYSPW